MLRASSGATSLLLPRSCRPHHHWVCVCTLQAGSLCTWLPPTPAIAAQAAGTAPMDATSAAQSLGKGKAGLVECAELKG
jgi:hypothetical protein